MLKSVFLSRIFYIWMECPNGSTCPIVIPIVHRTWHYVIIQGKQYESWSKYVKYGIITYMLFLTCFSMDIFNTHIHKPIYEYYSEYFKSGF